MRSCFKDENGQKTDELRFGHFELSADTEKVAIAFMENEGSSSAIRIELDYKEYKLLRRAMLELDAVSKDALFRANLKVKRSRDELIKTFTEWATDEGFVCVEYGNPDPRSIKSYALFCSDADVCPVTKLACYYSNRLRFEIIYKDQMDEGCGRLWIKSDDKYYVSYDEHNVANIKIRELNALIYNNPRLFAKLGIENGRAAYGFKEKRR